MNPITVETKPIRNYFMDWNKMNSTPYDKNTVDAYTKVRVILMNGTEFESNWFLHQFARHCDNLELKGIIAVIRAQEQQQQKRLASLKPIDENMLETTISYEQLAIDLTAILSKMETDKNNINALNFALLEDFDHLYRFANLLKIDYNIDADMLVGKFTEITPARPTISEHRYAKDNIKRFMNAKDANTMTKLVANIITAAEQQTMNFYMNLAAFYQNEYGRKLFSEIALIEEEHVSQYESLKDPNCTWLESWVMHEYTECYLYYSMMNDEKDEKIREIYHEHFEMEVAHLKTAIDCLEKFENKDIETFMPNFEFPQLLKFGENKEFIREVLKNTVSFTGNGDGYIPVDRLKDDSDFFVFQDIINKDIDTTPSHDIINRTINILGHDYRYEENLNPIVELQNRQVDNTSMGRTI